MLFKLFSNPVMGLQRRILGLRSWRWPPPAPCAARACRAPPLATSAVRVPCFCLAAGPELARADSHAEALAGRRGGAGGSGRC